MSSLTFRALSACYVALESYKNGILLVSLAFSCGYSSWVLGLNGLQLFYTLQPAHIGVALLGLALFPTARARLSGGQSSGCSSSAASLAGQQGSSEACSRQGTAAGCSSAGQDSSETGLGTPFRLAGPPFSADLSYGASPSYSCSSSSSSITSRRRRLPRVSIELTPLPRLSLEFQHRASSHRDSSRASLDDCSLYSPSNSGHGLHSSSSSWQPSMTRIRSGHDLQLLGDNAANAVQMQQQQHMPWPAGLSLQDAPTAGEATESLGHSPLAEGLEQIREVVNETHLLQVGAMLGEASSRAALVAREAGGPVGHPTSFYGSADTDDFLEPWDLLVSESNPNVLYWAWRRPLRKGLYMYMTRSVFLGASPAELRAFMNDDAYRVVWDNAMAVLRPMAAACLSGAGSSSNASVEAMAAAMAARTAGLAPSCSNIGAAAQPAAEAGGTPSDAMSVGASMSLSPFAADSSDEEPRSGSTGSTTVRHELLPHESAIMQALVQFPKPMASRSYTYARRVWHRPSDGGCYCLSKSCSFDNPLPLPNRAVAVEDYVAGCAIRTPAPQLLPPGCSGPAAEVLLVYYEDSHVRPGLANLGIKKGLWPLVQRTDKALRVYQAGAAANVHLQSPQPPATPRQQHYGSEAAASSALSTAALLQQQGSLATQASSSCTAMPCSPEEVTGAASKDSTNEPEIAAADEVAAEAAAVAEGDGSNTVSTASCARDACCPSLSSHAAPPAGSSNSSSKASSSSAAGGKAASSSRGKARSKGASWDWWHRITNTVGGVIRGSGQLLAAASVALWRCHTRLALMVPVLEWKLLHWLLRRLTAPTQLLLGAPSASAGSSNRQRSSLAAVNSHPIGDWAHPGLLQRLQQSNIGPSLLRVSSHPLAVEDLAAAAEPESPPSRVRCHSRHLPAHALQYFGNGISSSQLINSLCHHHCDGCCCLAAVHAGFGGSNDSYGTVAGAANHEQQLQLGPCSQEPLLGADWPSASAAETSRMHSMLSTCMHAHNAPCCCMHAHRARLAASTAAAAVAEEASSCCSCAMCTSTAAAACIGPSASCSGSCCSSRCDGMRSSSCSSSRVSGGGRRHRRLVVRLMQAASVRLAHKLLSALENDQRRQDC